VSGEVKVNGRVVTANDFGKFGCFVQQDDILIAVMTARESLRFACKLRTSLDGEEVEERIDLVVEKLALHKC
jgi:ABC-type multidrug transport system ATPase subunit